MTLPAPRIVFCIIALGATGAILIALYMQYQMGLEPCHLCIIQRVFVMAAGAVALMAFVHNPDTGGRKVYSLGLTASAIGGGAFSIRQLYLQSLPADQVPSCGPSANYLLDSFPLMEALSIILKGDGNCAKVAWSFLGLSIPGWTLVGFSGLAAIGIWQFLRKS